MCVMWEKPHHASVGYVVPGAGRGGVRLICFFVCARRFWRFREPCMCMCVCVCGQVFSLKP